MFVHVVGAIPGAPEMGCRMKSKSIKKSMGKFKWMRAFFPAFPSTVLLKGRHGNGVFYWMLGLRSVLDASLRPRTWNESQGRRWAEVAAGYVQCLCFVNVSVAYRLAQCEQRNHIE